MELTVHLSRVPATPPLGAHLRVLVHTRRWERRQTETLILFFAIAKSLEPTRTNPSEHQTRMGKVQHKPTVEYQTAVKRRGPRRPTATWGGLINEVWAENSTYTTVPCR